MANGYVRQATANIQANLEINAEDFNTEYDALASAFDNTTGHDHSGSATGTGAKISLTTSVTGTLPIANGGTALTTAGSSGQVPISNGTILVMGNVGLDISGYGSYSTVSATAVHAGKAFTHALSKTTRIMIFISGIMSNNTNSDGTAVSIRWGTGAAPAAGAAVTGTNTGSALYGINPAGQNSATFPFTCVGVATGLTVGTTYWVDPVVNVITGGTSTIDNLAVFVLEI